MHPAITSQVLKEGLPSRPGIPNQTPHRVLLPQHCQWCLASLQHLLKAL